MGKEKRESKFRMGNLTLLYNDDNSSLSNNIYKDKKDCYKKADFILTQTLIEEMTTTHKHSQNSEQCAKINQFEKQYNESPEGHFTKQMIESRSKEMADLLYYMLTTPVQ